MAGLYGIGGMVSITRHGMENGGVQASGRGHLGRGATDNTADSLLMLKGSWI